MKRRAGLKRTGWIPRRDAGSRYPWSKAASKMSAFSDLLPRPPIKALPEYFESPTGPAVVYFTKPGAEAKYRKLLGVPRPSPLGRPARKPRAALKRKRLAKVGRRGKAIQAQLRKARKAVEARDGKRCARCSSTKRLELHHLCSRGTGGGHEPENLRLLCHDCHEAVTYHACADWREWVTMRKA